MKDSQLAGRRPFAFASALLGGRFQQLAFVTAALFCLTPFASPGLALGLGLILALAIGNPFPKFVKKTTKPLLQVSVVLLGFGMNLFAVLAAGRHGFLLAAATISLTFLLGAALRRVDAVKRSTATLLSAGTAICGGSAIAAVGLAITAAEAEMSVALGTVFMLNAVALYVFPVLGHAMGLSQVEFGTWAGIAIHDVSSVVGAASAYGQEALQTATAVKLSRTLWIVPVAFIAGVMMKRRAAARGTASAGPGKVTIPWFIGLFLLASLASTFLPPVHLAAPVLQRVARTGMTLTLLLIGAGLSRASLRSVGIRPVLHGLALWLVIAVVSLVALRWFGV
jgi:uncharacterized integral membrane protein (TIGR00698 family)